MRGHHWNGGARQRRWDVGSAWMMGIGLWEGEAEVALGFRDPGTDLEGLS